MNWILCEDPGAPLWCLQPMGEVHTHEEGQSVRSRPQSLRDSAITRRNACCSLAFFERRWKESLKKTTHTKQPRLSQNGHHHLMLRKGVSSRPKIRTLLQDIARSLIALHANMQLHLLNHAALTRFCMRSGAVSALPQARPLKKCAVS